MRARRNSTARDSPGFNVHPLPLAVSAIYGLLIALAFALPPLARARTVPAAGLFRAIVEGNSRIDRKSTLWVIGAISDRNGAPISAVTCSPLIDNRCASPLRRIASASASGMAP